MRARAFRTTSCLVPARYSLGCGLSFASLTCSSRHKSSSSSTPSSSQDASSLVTSQPEQTSVDATRKGSENADPTTASASSSSSSPRRRATSTGAVGTPGKTKRERATDIKVKKKAPWGVQQLRDSWSEDAMSKRDTENMSERIHREYRYHPDEQWRQWLKITAFLTIPCVFTGGALSYYVNTGKPFWQADPQHLLNLIRAPDMSPRSKLYPYRLEETYELPAHVQRHREAFQETRELRDRIFNVTHSAFTCLTPEVQRQLDAEAAAAMDGNV